MTPEKPAYHKKLEAYCRQRGIKWLATYDADIVRRNYGGADLYLLAEFEEGHKVGSEFFKIERELTDIIGGARGELRALPELADYYRDEILAAATVKFTSETASDLPQMLAEARESWAAIKAAENQAVRDKVKAMPSEELAEFCRSRGIKWLAACDEEISWRNHPGADLLLLAEFEEGYPKGWGPFKTESELSDLFGVVRAHIVSRPGARDNHSYWDRSLGDVRGVVCSMKISSTSGRCLRKPTFADNSLASALGLIWTMIFCSTVQ